jgi:hypothetical protein
MAKEMAAAALAASNENGYQRIMAAAISAII